MLPFALYLKLQVSPFDCFFDFFPLTVWYDMCEGIATVHHKTAQVLAGLVLVVLMLTQIPSCSKVSTHVHRLLRALALRSTHTLHTYTV